jgi:hypothetical protein
MELKMKFKKIALTLAAGSSVLAAALFSVHVFARPAYSTETDYYSDATKTEYVGTSTFTCTGKTVVEGQVTPYSTLVIRYRC